MKVIFVDDEPIILKSFLRQCQKIDFIHSIKTFRNAKDALRFAEVETFDIAFIDIELPKINGFELAMQLKKQQPNLIIIFVSALDPIFHPIDSSLSRGYIIKPFSSKSIKNAVQKAIDT